MTGLGLGSEGRTLYVAQSGRLSLLDPGTGREKGAVQVDGLRSIEHVKSG